jgi:hypothetical protein
MVSSFFFFVSAPAPLLSFHFFSIIKLADWMDRIVEVLFTQHKEALDPVKAFRGNSQLLISPGIIVTSVRMRILQTALMLLMLFLVHTTSQPLPRTDVNCYYHPSYERPNPDGCLRAIDQILLTMPETNMVWPFQVTNQNCRVSIYPVPLDLNSRVVTPTYHINWQRITKTAATVVNKCFRGGHNYNWGEFEVIAIVWGPYESRRLRVDVLGQEIEPYPSTTSPKRLPYLSELPTPKFPGSFG